MKRNLYLCVALAFSTYFWPRIRGDEYNAQR
jgi:hypothetical protein